MCWTITQPQCKYAVTWCCMQKCTPSHPEDSPFLCRSPSQPQGTPCRTCVHRLISHIHTCVKYVWVKLKIFLKTDQECGRGSWRTCVRSRRWNARSSGGSPTRYLDIGREPQIHHWLHQPGSAPPTHSSCSGPLRRKIQLSQLCPSLSQCWLELHEHSLLPEIVTT